MLIALSTSGRWIARPMRCPLWFPNETSSASMMRTLPPAPRNGVKSSPRSSGLSGTMRSTINFGMALSFDTLAHSDPCHPRQTLRSYLSATAASWQLPMCQLPAVTVSGHCREGAHRIIECPAGHSSTQNHLPRAYDWCHMPEGHRPLLPAAPGSISSMSRYRQVEGGILMQHHQTLVSGSLGP